MKSPSVQTLPLHKPIILKKDKSIRQAALAMNRNHVGSVIVSDGHGVLRGLFTDRDLALALALKNMETSVPLGEITQHSLLYVNESATLENVIDLMKKYAIRRVPVVRSRTNGKQTCLGIITLDDLIKEGLIDKKDEVQILRSQLKTTHERHSRGRLKSIFRSQEHKEHAMFTFLKSITENTGLSRVSAKRLALESLTMILGRVPEKPGTKLLAQLPHELQMQLLSEVSPADRSITATLILEQTQKNFKVPPKKAQELLQGFWRALSKAVSSSEIRKLERELPKEIIQIFYSRSSLT
ncbi:CBS domain-containing protein [Bdellovibrio bacteriovorus]|uniref:CBS domain-containing protein n=1 Tax=Bdellovibrio bacteriovorus TaxID=959 RepID=UPI00045C0DD1|nr:CBS domain-containing protein [Bdellovibrio bacteriovorus]AHZ86178.1 hypothetical protein EP01_14730 [Bdellovibrio bacteriovorus]BEV67414.1 hypothetical protein Bb109J_c0834 [Bdellovibrio bacteriovorus]